MSRLRLPSVIVLLALAAVLGLAVRRPADPALFPASGGAITVYVVDNGFHSNVVVPRALLLARGGVSAAAIAELPAGPWVALGWGDRRFFTETGLSAGRAADGLRALFAPGNPALVMYEPLRDRPDRLWLDGVVPVRLSPAGFERMMRRVDASVRLVDGAPVPGPRGPVTGARFFDSTETFSILRLCNHWTADVLHAAGVPHRPLLDGLGAGLAWDLRTWATRLEARP